jgi:hypothetical protein
VTANPAAASPQTASAIPEGPLTRPRWLARHCSRVYSRGNTRSNLRSDNPNGSLRQPVDSTDGGSGGTLAGGMVRKTGEGGGGGGGGAWSGCCSGRYHLPSDAIHQPGPPLTSDIAPPLASMLDGSGGCLRARHQRTRTRIPNPTTGHVKVRRRPMSQLGALPFLYKATAMAKRTTQSPTQNNHTRASKASCCRDVLRLPCIASSQAG